MNKRVVFVIKLFLSLIVLILGLVLIDYFIEIATQEIIITLLRGLWVFIYSMYWFRILKKFESKLLKEKKIK